MQMTVKDINGDKAELSDQTIADILDDLYMEFPDASLSIEAFIEWVREGCDDDCED